MRWTWHVASSQLHKLLEAQLTPLQMEQMMEKTEQAEGWDPLCSCKGCCTDFSPWLHSDPRCH